MAIFETFKVSTKKWLILNRIIYIKQEYLKPFDRVQKLNYWYYTAMRKTI